MAKAFDRSIIVEKIDEMTEQWVKAFDKPLHARINKARSDSEYLNAGSVQGKRSLVFEMRYFAALEDISLNLSSYRIVYNGVPYDIKDFDDYLLQHKTVKILGVSY